MVKRHLAVMSITDENGMARFDLPPGIGTFSIEKEGCEPVHQTVRITNQDQQFNVVLRPITKGFISLENVRLRGLIRSSSHYREVRRYLQQSEHLIFLASQKLKKCATNQFDKTSKVARGRIEELRRIESSIKMEIGHTRVGLSKSEKKQPTPP